LEEGSRIAWKSEKRKGWGNGDRIGEEEGEEMGGREMEGREHPPPPPWPS